MALEEPALEQKTHPDVGCMGVRADKIASTTIHVHLEEEVNLAPPREVRSGDVVAVRILTDNPVYNRLELTSGRLARLNPHDIVVGVLGARRALDGFVGDVPESLAVGDTLHILNLGGVIGLAQGGHSSLGNPIEAEVLGMVTRAGRPINIAEHRLPPAENIEASPPLVLVAGTCMNSGKTQAAVELIRQFTAAGKRVAAAKLTGVACLRDTLEMSDHGAIRTLSFLDCGLPSTVGLKDLRPLARTVIAALNQDSPDLIVLEMGDGLLGYYQVGSLFEDPQILRFSAAMVFCARDFVGAWGGRELLRARGLRIDVFTGAVTDSAMGVAYLESEFEVAAANAVRDGDRLHRIVSDKVEAWLTACA